MTDLRGKTALITGAANGIGREVARLLVAHGACVNGIDLDADGLARLGAELGPPFAWATADVTDVAALRDAARRLEEKAGHTDILIASAGVGRGTPAEKWSAEDVNAIININLIGVVNSIDCVLAGMRQRRSGQIVVLSSLASYRGMPLMAAYSASKAGCNALCDSLRVELADEGISVTTVCPGWVRTNMTAPLGLPDHMLMSVEAAARTVFDAVRRRTPFVAFPWFAAFQAWLMRVLPRWMGDWMARQFLRQARSLKPPA
jgi:NAD(P)-dependent dehydrogenase (short-subunit alcohol dehydrogenase family)